MVMLQREVRGPASCWYHPHAIGSSRLVLAIFYVVYSEPFYVNFVWLWGNSKIFPLVELSLLQQAITSGRGIQGIDEGFCQRQTLTPRTAASALVNTVNKRLPSAVRNWGLCCRYLKLRTCLCHVWTEIACRN